MIKKIIVILLSIPFIFFSFNIFTYEKLEVPLIYQLTNIHILNLVNHYKPKFLVIDYSKDGTEKNKFSPLEVKALKNTGAIVLAYLSIGEAESYRWYWKDSYHSNPPKWLGKENPMWPENYKVKYWENEWKQIIFEYLDKIIEQGFDGVYLDRIDSYKYWNENGYEISFTSKKMIEFIHEIFFHAKNQKSNFLIVPQNGEDIIEYDNNNIYINSISGIGIESLFYFVGEKIDDKIVNERLKYILKIKNSGKFVLVTDYIYNPRNPDEEKILNFIELCQDYGFYGYPANINLKLSDISGALKYYKKVKK